MSRGLDMDAYFESSGSNIDDVLGSEAQWYGEGGAVGGERDARGVGSEFVELAVASIRPSQFQARRVFDEDAIAGLAADIERNGLLQPIVVRSVAGEEGQYELVAGERRWQAVRLLCRETILARVREFSDFEAHVAGFTENGSRSDLSPWEQAAEVLAIRQHAERTWDKPVTDGALGETLGVDRQVVNRSLRIAGGVNEALIQAAGVSIEEVCLLTRVALLKVARIDREEERSAALREEVDKVRGIKTKGGRARSAIPENAEDRWMHYWGAGGFQVNIREPLSNLSKEQAASALERMSMGITLAAASTTGGLEAPPMRFGHGFNGDVIYVPAISEEMSAENRAEARTLFESLLQELAELP